MARGANKFEEGVCGIEGGENRRVGEEVEVVILA